MLSEMATTAANPLSEDDVRTYGIEHGLFFVENMFLTSRHYIRPLAVYFDPAHNEDYYYGMQPGGKYLFKPQAVPTTDPSAFGILPSEVTSKIFRLAIQDDYATQHMLSMVTGKNTHLSKFKTQIQFHHNLENVSALETRIMSHVHKNHLVFDKLQSKFKMPFLLLSDALIQGYVTLFHWMVSTDISCRELMLSIMDVVSGSIQRTIPLSYIKNLDMTTQREPIVKNTVEIFNPFADFQSGPKPVMEDVMDIDEESRPDKYYYNWEKVEWWTGLRVRGNPYFKSEIFKHYMNKNHSLQVTRLFVFMIECYLTSPMRGPLLDPTISAEYMKRMADQMSNSPNCWTWDCMPDEQRNLYKNFNIKLTNPFNLLDTDADWNSIVQNNPTSSILCRTHHYIHRLQLITAKRMVEFFFNFIPTEEQPNIDVQHFPMLGNLTKGWADQFGTNTWPVKSPVLEWINTLFLAGNMVFVPQFIRTLGTFATHCPIDNDLTRYAQDFPLNFESFKHGTATTAANPYPSHYFPYTEGKENGTSSDPAIFSNIFLNGTMGMIKNKGYTSITLDQKYARNHMQSYMSFEQYKEHVWNVQQMFFNLVKPFYTFNYSKTILNMLENPNLITRQRNIIMSQLNKFNIHTPSGPIYEIRPIHETGSEYLNSMEILPHYWLHNWDGKYVSYNNLINSAFMDYTPSMMTLFLRMIENNQLEMILWLARQLLVVTSSPKIAETYKYRNISFAYAQISFFQHLVCAIKLVRNRSIVTYLRWVQAWIFDLFIANIQEMIHFDSIHGKIFNDFPCFGILANQPFAVWLALTWIGYYSTTYKYERIIMNTMTIRTWSNSMKMFFMDLIYPPNTIYGLEASVHHIELVHYLRELLQFHTILPITEGGTKAGFDGLELTIDRLPNPYELQLYNTEERHQRSFEQICYHGVMAAVNADLYNAILYRNAPTNPKVPLTPWALEFFRWSTPMNRTLIDFNFLTVDGFNVNSVMVNMLHMDKIKKCLALHADPETEDSIMNDEKETLTSLAAVFSLLEIMAKWNLPIPNHLAQLYLDPRQRALYSTVTAVPNSLFEFLVSVAFPGCTLDGIVTPVMADFSALTEPHTFIRSDIHQGVVNGLCIRPTSPQPISLLIAYKKLREAMKLWNRMAVKATQTWMFWSQLFSQKDHTSTRVMDFPTESRQYFKSKLYGFAKCWENPLEDETQVTSTDQLTILKKFMLLPNNLLHFFGQLESTHREEAIEHLLSTNIHAVNTPMVLREELGRFFIWMHISAYGKILDVKCKYGKSALIPWVSLSSGIKLLTWTHTMYCAPKIQSISKLFEYNKPAATSDNIAQLERHNRNLYNRSFIAHDGSWTDMTNIMYRALINRNFQQFTFFRDNYQMLFKNSSFRRFVDIQTPCTLVGQWIAEKETRLYIQLLNTRLPRNRINQLNIPANCGPQPILNLTPQEYKSQLLSFTRKRANHNKRLAAADVDTIIAGSAKKKKQRTSLKRKLQLLTNIEDGMEEQEGEKRARSEEEENVPFNPEESEDNPMQVVDAFINNNNNLNDMDLLDRWFNS